MTEQVRVNVGQRPNGGRFRGESATSLRLKAALELVLQLTLIAPVLSILWNGLSVIPELRSWPEHVGYVVRCLITGKRV